MADDTMKQPVSDTAMDKMSVAPPRPDREGAARGGSDRPGHPTGGPADPPQGPKDEDTVIGQDDDIAERLARNPGSAQAQLDEGLAESMDGSDPPSASRSGDSGDPMPSSGYDG